MEVEHLPKISEEAKNRKKFVGFFLKNNYYIKGYIKLYFSKRKHLSFLDGFGDIFIYDEWISIKLSKEKFSELKGLLEEFDKKYKIKIICKVKANH